MTNKKITFNAVKQTIQEEIANDEKLLEELVKKDKHYICNSEIKTEIHTLKRVLNLLKLIEEAED